MKKFFKTLAKILLGLIFVLSYTVYIACKWTSMTFGVEIEQILFTLSAPIEGSDSNVIYSVLYYCLPRIGVVILIYLFFAIVFSKAKLPFILVFKNKIKFNLSRILKTFVALSSVLSIVFTVKYVDDKFDIFDYIKESNSYTQIYEEYYVDPNDVPIMHVATKKLKNLIYIYVESMETTYTSVENGGNQDICYIPNLVSLANENISFSDGEGIGGFHNVKGTTYTMGSLLGTTSGIPFSFPVEGNSMNTREKFATGLTNLGDILDKFGYSQEFICGSDGDYAGRKNYFMQHGNYDVYDYFTAKEEGRIPEDYRVFWGYEDKRLFEIAKDELTTLSQGDNPFNFTLLTVDTHHISGYVCDICGNEYDMQTKNVVSCCDRQVAEFVKWCQSQEFYKDTVIIVTGDHPRMDNDMVDGIKYYDRTIYNCFINCDVDKNNLKTTNRIFTPLDIFPTTLSALGFEWDGNRLGLGTDMFSGEDTLAEQLGFNYFNAELGKKSLYYRKFY